MKFSKRLDNFPEYIFVSLQRAKKTIEEQSNRPVLDLGPGSPDVLPSRKYLDKLKGFLEEDQAHMYPGYGAIPEFQEGLIQWYRERFGVKLESDELYPLLGAKEGISHLSLALLDADDEVLIPNPGYPAYAGAALMIGAKPIPYNLLAKNDFQIHYQSLEGSINERTRFIWVNFPNNPTGAVVDKQDLEKLVKIAQEHNIWIIYDNAYSEITFDGYRAPSILEIPGAKEVACEIGSLSKTFSFAGYRIGYIVGNKGLIAALAKIKSQVDSGMAKPLQKLAAYALTHIDQKWHQNMLESYVSRRDIIGKYLSKLGLSFKLSKGSLYIWARIPQRHRNSEAFVKELLRDKQILLTPGTAFGQNGRQYVRASICANIEKIEEYL